MNRRLLERYLEMLERKKFFGEIIMKFESGQAVQVKSHETLKEDDLRELIVS